MNQWQRGTNDLNHRKQFRTWWAKWISSCPDPYILQRRNVKPPKNVSSKFVVLCTDSVMVIWASSSLAHHLDISCQWNLSLLVDQKTGFLYEGGSAAADFVVPFQGAIHSRVLFSVPWAKFSEARITRTI